MFRNFKMVSKVVYGRGCFSQLGEILHEQRQGSEAVMVFILDDVFKAGRLQARLPLNADDMIIWANVDEEPKTVYVDQLTMQVKEHMAKRRDDLPSGVIGIGGGSMTVPFLHACRVDMRQAVATSSACGLPIAVSGALGFVWAGWGHAQLPPLSSGFVYWPAFAGIIATSLV